ncbi:MAG: hypothetical protein AVDCRST_MAG59-3612, partial [uncultured Thermomicrobiales bacterium]
DRPPACHPGRPANRRRPRPRRARTGARQGLDGPRPRDGVDLPADARPPPGRAGLLRRQPGDPRHRAAAAPPKRRPRPLRGGAAARPRIGRRRPRRRRRGRAAGDARLPPGRDSRRRGIPCDGLRRDPAPHRRHRRRPRRPIRTPGRPLRPHHPPHFPLGAGRGRAVGRPPLGRRSNCPARPLASGRELVVALRAAGRVGRHDQSTDGAAGLAV